MKQMKRVTEWVMGFCLVLSVTAAADGKHPAATEEVSAPGAERTVVAKRANRGWVAVGAEILRLKRDGQFARGQLITRHQDLTRSIDRLEERGSELMDRIRALQKPRPSFRPGSRERKREGAELARLRDRYNGLVITLNEQRIKRRAVEVVIYAPIDLATFQELRPEVYELALANQARDLAKVELSPESVVGEKRGIFYKLKEGPVSAASDANVKPASEAGPDVQSLAPVGNTNQAGVAN
ncbi:MAG: hypothetical protein AB7P04_10475 [Bacteriovoracia bacterium]